MSDSASGNAGRSPATESKPVCSAIRSKGFYVYTETPPPPEESDTAVFWCLKTMSAVGPDGELVHKSCCDPSRSCFEGPKP
jgi:hypothetical protein